MDTNQPTDMHAGPHGAEAGPVDLPRWGAAGLGIVLGLAVAVALAIGASFQLTFGG
ncbi:MAG TPA: hypothetical protein VEX41_01320 [Candidatus Eisenbacteria bacterium]|nr:hypothetical protein [Candidatus Eisenbacteria bacterium]